MEFVTIEAMGAKHATLTVHQFYNQSRTFWISWYQKRNLDMNGGSRSSQNKVRNSTKKKTI